MTDAPTDYQGPAAFDGWMTDMVPELLLLADLLPDDVALDFAPASLPDLEVEIMSRYEQRSDLEEDEERERVDGLVRYLGEILLAVGGGRWAWQPEAGPTYLGRAVIVPDAGDDRAVAPFEILVAAAQEQTGEVLPAALADVQAGVLDRIRSQPYWRPVKARTPGLDRAAEPDPELDTWTTARIDAFESWSREAGGPWDFTADSLQRLEQRIAGGAPEGDGPMATDADEMAAWYLGEVLLRAAGGWWCRLPASQALGVQRQGGWLKRDVITVDPFLVLAGIRPEGLHGALEQYTGAAENRYAHDI